MTTPNMSFPELTAAQGQKYLTVNQAINYIDATVQLSVINRTTNAPPGSPTPGDRYIVGGSPTGVWASHALELAAFIGSAWVYFEPKEGWFGYDQGANELVIFNGSSWQLFTAGILSTTLFGINATADTTNRLFVKSDAVMFSHDDVTPGSGDIYAAVNKSGTGKNAAFVFNNAYSARALFGLLGNDDFTLKVSPDGSSYKEAIVVDKDDASVEIKENTKFQTFINYDFYVAADTWTKVTFNDTDHNDYGDVASGVFTAAVPGYYMFFAKAKYKINGATSADPTQMKFYKNNTAVERSLFRDLDGAAGDNTTLLTSMFVKLAAGDTIDVRVLFSAFDGYVEANTNLFYGYRVS